MGIFEHVIVIGYGVITGEVLSVVDEYSSQYNYSLEYIEYEVYPFNAAKKYAEANGLDYQLIEDAHALTDYFMQRAMASKLLIISASNNYLFPKSLVENENVTIINFHNALLPDLPGRNAPSWAIFEGRKKTGITWHYVTTGVDAGDIIIQKECEISGDIRAYELAAAQMKLAAEAFAECYVLVLNEKVEVVKQEIPDNRRLYKSKEVPGDGLFDLRDDPEYIYKLLRAMDYGKNDIFPLPMTYYHGQKIRIRRYKKIKAEEKKESHYKLFLPYGDDYCLMLKYDILGDNGEIGGVIDDIEYLYKMVSELKRVNRRLLSNVYLSEEELTGLITKEELYYLYLPEKYLNICFPERDYIRLYYYIADIDSYESIATEKKVICELYAAKENVNNENVKKKLEEKQYKVYASYHKWVGKELFPYNDVKSGYRVIYDQVDGLYEGITSNFDTYSDHVPTADSIEDYFMDKKFYVLKDDDNHLVGGLVVAINGKVQTEEFIFINDEFRNRGLAAFLHNLWYSSAGSSDTIQYVAWIRDDNEASIRLHSRFGYVRQDTYKITMQKGI